ncbi:hypothetical protein V5799_004344 [Amblyomma americanum]|uniref:Uncharacterized protein n=1 Tax=Amblyomma americanum TaxID=6943 RepID=A0AAQ4D6E1_AMBAM
MKALCLAVVAAIACLALAEKKAGKEEKVEGRGGLGGGYGGGYGPGVGGIGGVPVGGVGYGGGLGHGGFGHGGHGGGAGYGQSAGGFQGGFRQGAAGFNQGSGGFSSGAADRNVQGYNNQQGYSSSTVWWLRRWILGTQGWPWKPGLRSSWRCRLLEVLEDKI